MFSVVLCLTGFECWSPTATQYIDLPYLQSNTKTRLMVTKQAHNVHVTRIIEYSQRC